MKKTSGGGEYVPQDRGDRMRPRASHPRYWQLKLLLQKLRHVTESELIPTGGKLLDYACGDRPYESLFRTKFEEYIGADLPGNDKAELTIGRHGEVPQDDESVNCVLSTQVLEHVEDPAAYLSEAYRILQPGGYLILSTHGFWPYHPDPTDFWRWTIDGLHRQIGQAGFEIVLTQAVFGLTSVAIQLWQDATNGFLPPRLRKFYVRFIQAIIGWIERRDPDKCSLNASVFVILARKGAAG